MQLNVERTKCMQDIVCGCSVRIIFLFTIIFMRVMLVTIKTKLTYCYFSQNILQGVPERSNTRSYRCRCPTMILLLCSKDIGWYISEHMTFLNHSLTDKRGEKLYWPSHKHIDIYTRDLVKQLRENNISISKVYNIIDSFFGSMSNVSLRKRALRGLC